MLVHNTAMEMKTTQNFSVLCQENVTNEKEKQSLLIEQRFGDYKCDFIVIYICYAFYNRYFSKKD